MIRRKSRRRKTIISVFIGLVSALFIFMIAIVVLYLMAVYKPAEYKPEPIDFQQQEQAVDQAIALIADIHNNVYANDSFSETVTASLLNKLLLHDDLRRMLEKETVNSDIAVKHPQVSMRDELLIFYITMTYSRHSAVVSISLKPYITNEGKLKVDLKSIKSGALGLPMMTVRSNLIKLADKIKKYTVSSDSTSAKNDKRNIEKELGVIIGQALPELLKNGSIIIDPVINNPDDDNKQIKLTKIKLDKQTAILDFQQIKN